MTNSPSSSYDDHSHREDRIENQTPVKQTTLVYVFNPEGQMLLAVKKNTQSGFDVALEKVNTAGGKKEPDESIEDSALRELEDEFGIIASKNQLIYCGKIIFLFETKKKWESECHVYKIINYKGSHKKNDQDGDEMKSLQYFDVNDLPRDKMRESDTIWLPKMLRGGMLNEEFHHSDEGKVKSHTTRTE